MPHKEMGGMPYYRAKYSVLKKSPKYPLYMNHFENIPVLDVEFEYKKDTDEVVSFYLLCETIESLNDAIGWVEDATGFEPITTEWIEEKESK